MKIDINGVVYSLSYALDCIEAEVTGATKDHAKWVAYLSALLGKSFQYSLDELIDLSVCAALHDNALLQYLAEEHTEDLQDIGGSHCIVGENNVIGLPFRTDSSNFILYHHENADGTGPFRKHIDEIPIQAHIIHLTDIVDVVCQLHFISEENYEKARKFLNEQRNVMFCDDMVDRFFQVLPKEKYLSLEGRSIDELLCEEVPHNMIEYPFEQIRNVLELFGNIVDFKSTFTRNHSSQIAKKILRMAAYYGYCTDVTERLYIAAVLHDVGKMAIKNDVLEKPDRLSDSEFVYMQNHAWYTYQILSKIHGFEDITAWASHHHEKLNGKGYPFGLTADELGEQERLMACVDIYQALSEERPYKAGMPHQKCIAIMRDMVAGGFIDGRITEHLNEVFA